MCATIINAIVLQLIVSKEEMKCKFTLETKLFGRQRDLFGQKKPKYVLHCSKISDLPLTYSGTNSGRGKRSFINAYSPRLVNLDRSLCHEAK